MDQMCLILKAIQDVTATVKELSIYRDVNPRELTSLDVNGHTYVTASLTNE